MIFSTRVEASDSKYAILSACCHSAFFDWILGCDLKIFDSSGQMNCTIHSQTSVASKPYQRPSTTRCGNMPIYWQHGPSESRAPDCCRLPGPLITYMKQGWTKMLWAYYSIHIPCTKPSSLASLSVVASCDIFFKVRKWSHRHLLEWKNSGIVIRFSSCIGPEVTNITCFLWLTPE